MEMVSYLAGERWSDHPKCTHPLLGELARLVNDNSSEPGRRRLVPLIPSVIGVDSDALEVDLMIALRAATTALPISPSARQGSLAVGVLACERLLDAVDHPDKDRLHDVSRNALAQAPEANRWASAFARRVGTTPNDFRRRSAPNVVRGAVDGVAHACVPDPDALLYALLAGAIDDVRGWCQTEEGKAAQETGRTHGGVPSSMLGRGVSPAAR
ncbi:MAG: hypothetical protein ACRDP4_12240 [Nocardioidaceae bacterium]